MRFPYDVKGEVDLNIKRVFPHREKFYKPEIKIVVEYQNKKIKLFALVDSGADSCLFPGDVAEVLNIDARLGIRIDYVGLGNEKVPFYFHEVKIYVGNYWFKTMAGFTTRPIGTTALLGQQGLFENFIVTFNHKNKFFESNGSFKRQKTS